MKALFTLLFAMFSLLLHAQAPETVEMADTMRSNGKIYVVVGVLIIIYLGIVAYLFSLDRKVCRLEKAIKSR